ALHAVNRILLIEDDTSAQLLYKNRLSDLGYEVVVAPTGAAGLMEARAAGFDLFLVDIDLGKGIDGYEVCRRLKTVPELHGIPVVLISGHVRAQEDLHKGYEAGCQSFLVKGDLMLLEDVVRAMLRIRSLQRDLALQNRLLEERNRRLEVATTRTADLEHALSSSASRGLSPASRPEGILVVDGEGVVLMADRGARELFGQELEGRHLGRVAPDSRLEASVRNARTEAHEALRFTVPERSGRAPRQLVADVCPLVPRPDRSEPTPRIVLLFDAARRRSSEPSSGEPSALRREWGPLVEAAREVFQPQALLGTSPAIRDLRARLARAARSDAPTLLLGPAGSGKGFAARILHFSGGRGGPFVSLACGSVDRGELEGELFGKAKVANEAEQAGALQQAQGGTLYLQDIELLPVALRQRLLQAIESGRVTRAGGSGEEACDVRLVVGSRRDLARAVEAGELEPALLAPFAGEILRLPALGESVADLEILTQHFLARHARFEEARLTSEAAAALALHDWPENVRELARLLQGACELARTSEIRLEDLPSQLVDRFRAQSLASTRAALPRPRPKAGFLPASALDSAVSLLDVYEKHALLHALSETDGDKLAAAKLVGVGKSTFYRKLKTHGIK
ncbi:MAG: sigma 54-interacting transcriptional regulator, partial [Planctomycetota bacterium]